MVLGHIKEILNDEGYICRHGTIAVDHNYREYKRGLSDLNFKVIDGLSIYVAREGQIGGIRCPPLPLLIGVVFQFRDKLIFRYDNNKIYSTILSDPSCFDQIIEKLNQEKNSRLYLYET